MSSSSPPDDPLWAELFGPDIEVDLQTQVDSLIDQNRQGRQAIAKALRVLHDAVGTASAPLSDAAGIDSAPPSDAAGIDSASPSDADKLTAILAAIGVAIDTLDPDGEGVDEPMSDSD